MRARLRASASPLDGINSALESAPCGICVGFSPQEVGTPALLQRLFVSRLRRVDWSGRPAFESLLPFWVFRAPFFPYHVLSLDRPGTTAGLGLSLRGADLMDAWMILLGFGIPVAIVLMLDRYLRRS